MGKRRHFLRAALAVLAMPGVTEWALGQSGSPPRVVWLIGQPVRGDSGAGGNDRESAKAIRAALASAGLVDGRDMALSVAEIPNTSGLDSELPLGAETEAFISRVIDSHPAVIVTVSRPELWLLSRSTRKVPIVFYNLGPDPSKMGVVQSLRRPGGNVTGTHVGWQDIHTRQWQLLKELVPSMRRGAILAAKVSESGKEDAFYQVRKQVMKEATQQAASRFHIEVVDIEISRNASEKEVVEVLRKARVDVVNAGHDATTPAVLSALKRLKLPACGHSVRHVRQGLLMGITFDYTEGQKHAATIVARIVRGEHPSVIPVYQTTQYFLVVNRSTARAIGIEFPESILIQAEEVID